MPLQVPQLAAVRLAPQLSMPVRLPQFLPRRVQKAASVSELQLQTFGVTAPQVLGDVQPAPKLQSATVRRVPQLSAAVTLLQFFPSLAQNAPLVSGWQPH